MERIRNAIATGFKLILIGLLAVNCSRDEFEFQTKEATIEDIKEIVFPEEFPLGLILSFKEINDSTYIFSDMSRRGIFKLQTNKNKIVQLGRQGRGPGEYSVPTFIISTSDSAILFSDASSSLIKKISLDNGEGLNFYIHKFGGNRKFYKLNNDIYILGSNNLINKIRNDSIIADSYISLNTDLSLKSRHFSGGGITKINNNLYAMNSLIPVIYTLNLNTFSIDSINIDAWDRFKLNANYDWIISSDKNKIFDNQKEMAVFNNLYSINNSGKNYLVIHILWKEKHMLQFFDPNINDIMYSYISDNSIIEVNDDKIFFKPRGKDINSITSANYVLD